MKKSLLDLNYYKKGARTFYELKFYTLERAQKILAREVPREEMLITVTRCRVDKITTYQTVTPSVYACCPSSGHRPECTKCGFSSGMFVNTGAVLHRGIKDETFMDHYLLTQLKIRTSFACGKKINPRYKPSDTKQVLLKINDHETFHVYILLDAGLSPADTKKFLEGRTLRVNFKLSNLSDGQKVMVGEPVLSYKESEYIFGQQLYKLLAPYEVPLNKFTKAIQDVQRLSRASLLAGGVAKSDIPGLCTALLNDGFITHSGGVRQKKNKSAYSGGSYYKKRKLSYAIKYLRSKNKKLTLDL